MKKRTIIDIILIFVLLGVLVYLGKIDYKQDEKKDSKRFDKDYSMVSKDNVFKYVNDEQLYDLLYKEDIIVFFGFKESKWCNYYAKILNDAAEETGVKKIYYYDFLIDREKSSTYYKKIVDYTKNYLRMSDTGTYNIAAPSLMVVKDKNIVYFDDETSSVYTTYEPNKYWNDETIANKKEQLSNVFNGFLGKNIGGLDGGEE